MRWNHRIVGVGRDLCRSSGPTPKVGTVRPIDPICVRQINFQQREQTVSVDPNASDQREYWNF